jgi:integrase
MKKKHPQILVIPEFIKFITASRTGKRLTPSCKKVRPRTISQYKTVLNLLEVFEKEQPSPLRIQLLHRSSLRNIQKEKNYWSRFFNAFSSFLYKKRKCTDSYVSMTYKVIKAFFNYLKIEKALPVGEFHRRFRIPKDMFNPIILSPAQLKFLITNEDFENSLTPTLKKIKDIFIFGCTVALRYQDLMSLKRENIQYATDRVYVVLHTQKTGSEIKVPLPEYAVNIVEKYKRQNSKFVLPTISNVNLNLHIKTLIKKAGWDYNLPKIRHRQGIATEIKTKYGEGFKFYNHITAHTMRRTAITTLLLLGVDETSVRRISGHAPGSTEFYRYVVIIQDYLNAKVIAAHAKLINDTENLKFSVLEKF